MLTITALQQWYEDLLASSGDDWRDVPCGEATLAEIERVLGVTLPEDYKQISRFSSYAAVGGIWHYGIELSDDPHTMVNQTLLLRKLIHLPHEYLVLAEPDESLLVLNTQQKPRVRCLDAVQAPDLAVLGADEYDAWDEYADYFLWLLQQEEEWRDDGG
ncbi:SMI1/KNR4 family protein [Vitreoscilla massiliensis]|uniref:SMI1/KNR4 family protein n=1 Tax=Vitreoscilla massiliensis TaxID=1689272 RepID=A0ABY4E5S2_9NEIS|nr:SMI1/KNR4 family protein [Vitreoscilla massiliensis]UOO91133.1 SMI1/KNR4 family protein [Vitreoscilla massiliensis]